MYTAAICDDEQAVARYVTDSVSARFSARQKPISADWYTDPAALEKRMSSGLSYDVLFLDIDMPGLDGIELCRRFREMGVDSLVVFVSNKEDMVFQTFDVLPFRFLRKSRFAEEIDKLCQDLLLELERRQERWLRFQTEPDGVVCSVNIQKLVYVEARGKLCVLRSTIGTQEVRVRLSDMEQMLKPHGFLQVHRSYLVNPYYIYRIDADTVLLDQGERVPLSRRRREGLTQEFFRWSRGEDVYD